MVGPTPTTSVVTMGRVKPLKQELHSEMVDRHREATGASLLQKLKFGKEVGDSSANALTQIKGVKPAVSEQSMEDADEIFKKMKETGLIPNAVAMLDGLCKDGLVQEAMKLAGLMREKGTIPEVVVYTAVVEGFCKAGKFDDAKREFRKMQTNEISSNAFSYGLLIQGLCRRKRLSDWRISELCIEDSSHYWAFSDRLCYPCILCYSLMLVSRLCLVRVGGC